MNSAASLAAGLPVGRLSVRCLVIAAYALPALAVWALAGALLSSVPLAAPGLVLTVGYGLYYGLTEVTRIRGLMAPGRRWQVPQTMMINASPRRRVLVWGAVLGPGFLTRNPYAGFGMLPLALAVTGLAGARAAAALGAGIGLAHGGARAVALLADVGALCEQTSAARRGGELVPAVPAGMSGASGAGAQLEVLLRAVHARRIDGAVLLVIAVTAGVLAVRYF